MEHMSSQETKDGIVISVIIPIYNTFTYLPTLFENIREQNLADTEVILIDDGSTDGSSDELDRLSKGTDFIVIHQANAGVAAARNHALDIARGEYICFIDPDDSISLDYIHDLHKAAISTHADLIVTDWRKYINGIPQPLYLAQADFPQYPTNQRVLTEILSTGRIIGSLWAKLFSAKLFEGNRFPAQRTSSDYLPVITAICKAGNIEYVPGIFYGYTSDRTDSLQNNQRAQDIRDSAHVHELTAQLIRDTYPDLANLLKMDRLNSAQQACMHICRSQALSSSERKSLFKQYRRPIAENIGYLLKRKGSLKYKVLMISIAFGYNVTNFTQMAYGTLRNALHR